MRNFIKPMSHLIGISTGWGNGYVVIPKGHPLHGKGYDSLNVNIHGGLTYANSVDELDWDEFTKGDKGGWVVGFDCAHYGDTSGNCPESFVMEESMSLKNQLEKLES